MSGGYHKNHIEMQRVSPDNITSLQPHEVFVYGANEAGIHGAGAAKTAYEKFGAEWRQYGFNGQTYGIPTKSTDFRILWLEEIRKHIHDFWVFAHKHRELTFLVTQIGCGYAGYTPKEIAPLFRACLQLQNVYLPLSFHNELR